MKTVWTIAALSWSVIGFGAVAVRAQSEPQANPIDEPPAFFHRIKGDIDGDGRSNILVLEIRKHCVGFEESENQCAWLDEERGSAPVVHTSKHVDWPMAVLQPLDPDQDLPEGPWQVTANGDFNGDGKPDLFWQKILQDAQGVDQEPETVVGVKLTLSPPGPERAYSQPPPASDPGLVPPPESWTLIGSGDFGSWRGVSPGESLGPPDGRDDLLWRDGANGDLHIFLSDGAGFPVSLQPPGTDAANVAVAVADIDGDGTPEIIFRDGAGLLSYWKMDGLSHTSGALNPSHAADSNWSIVAAGDFDGDGYDDLLWRNDFSLRMVIWFMHGPDRVMGGFLAPPSGCPTGITRDDICHESRISGPR